MGPPAEPRAPAPLPTAGGVRIVTPVVDGRRKDAHDTLDAPVVPPAPPRRRPLHVGPSAVTTEHATAESVPVAVPGTLCPPPRGWESSTEVARPRVSGVKAVHGRSVESKGPPVSLTRRSSPTPTSSRPRSPVSRRTTLGEPSAPRSPGQPEVHSRSDRVSDPNRRDVTPRPRPRKRFVTSQRWTR